MDNSKATILSAAVRIAKTRGLRAIKRETVSEAAGIATGTVNYHFGTMADLRDEVVKTAIAREVLPILAEAIVQKHRLVRNLSQDVRQRAFASL